MERLSPGRGVIGPQFWDGRAQRYADRLPVEAAAKDPFYRRLRRAVGPRSTVMDVGAGTGRFTINLATRAAEVIAVDPTEVMLDHLRAEAEQRGLTNIRVITGAWPDVDLEPVDIAFSSYVLPLIEDAPAFLAALDRVARRRAYVYLGAFSSDSAADPLWRHFHGGPRKPGPSYLDAVDVLAELGVEADVEVVELVNRTRYASLAEAVDDYRDFLVLADEPGVRQDLERILPSWLVRRNGALAPPLRYVPAAVISWPGGSIESNQGR
ncbi:MAG: class I SAM-dependent methyltransferase [Acidimicrobiales bacterium]